ncbi:hypothetical protein AB6F62_20625 [Providencia huaxiensis]|uniref:hypothetical protein n=1 Tax=Providencia TaxID=586 RepID=UPI001B389B8F|nr:MULTISPECIES: hypothetical protein [Providencia]EJD6370323.1 hypothetical protein [Providencia rettgeri]EJD6374747.1 hypothetical protein [Providencia rettgeri]ELR5033175.1 hypothetical protein [Providencia rettgeri]ELR5209007.1 hypothetical protein [Providencia rettgeri]MBQ0363648.1 hypothetical protein [Providencia rettgeri]
MSVAPEILIRTFEQSPEILEGLKSGLYKIWGGVIRITAGHDNAGSIVAHLKFPNDMSQARQSIESLQAVLSKQMDGLQGGIDVLQSSMGVLQNLQYANLAMSGLNLAVSVVGFAIVCHKLNRIEDTLNQHRQKLDALLEMAVETHQRERFRDESRFITSIDCARQFATMGDIQQLKSLIPTIKEQYEFTRLVLNNSAKKANNPVFCQSLNELATLQERFMYLGLILSYIQQKIGATYFAAEAIQKLQQDWLTINETIVSSITEDNCALRHIKKSEMEHLQKLLKYRKERLPALEYQSQLLTLAIERPDLLNVINDDSPEILLLAA